MLLYKNEKLEEAIENCLLGIKVQPHNTTIYFKLAALLIEAGSEKQGIQVFEEALANDYEKYIEAFEIVPSLQNNQALLEMLEVYKQRK